MGALGWSLLISEIKIHPLPQCFQEIMTTVAETE